MRRIVNSIRRHMADRESHHRKIVVGFMWVSLFVFVGRLAGAGKEMAIAWRYGVSEKVDAYVFLFNLVSLPISTWFGVLTVVLVPLVSATRHNPEGFACFRREFLGLTLVIGLLLGILSWIFLPILLKSGLVVLSETVLIEALRMAGGLTMLIPLGILISFLSAWMLSQGQHRNTLFEAIPALTILFVLLLPNQLYEPLLWGTIAGFTLQVIALLVLQQKRVGLEAPSFRFTSPLWHGFWGSLGIMGLGQVLMNLTGVVDQFFAGEHGAGAIATLSYANRILGLILSMGGIAVSRATLPVFSEASSLCNVDLNTIALSWAKWMFFLGLIVLLLVWAISSNLVEIVFQRGAFGEEDTKAVVSVFNYSLIQLPFYFSALVLHSFLSSQRKYKVISIVLAVCLFAKCGFNIILSKELGLIGLQLSTFLMYVVFCLFYIFIVVKSRPRSLNGTI